MGTNTNFDKEPSMAEILSAVRRIIAEDIHLPSRDTGEQVARQQESQTETKQTETRQTETKQTETKQTIPPSGKTEFQKFTLKEQANNLPAKRSEILQRLLHKQARSRNQQEAGEKEQNKTNPVHKNITEEDDLQFLPPTPGESLERQTEFKKTQIAGNEDSKNKVKVEDPDEAEILNLTQPIQASPTQASRQPPLLCDLPQPLQTEISGHSDFSPSEKEARPGNLETPVVETPVVETPVNRAENDERPVPVAGSAEADIQAWAEGKGRAYLSTLIREEIRQLFKSVLE